MYNCLAWITTAYTTSDCDGRELAGNVVRFAQHRRRASAEAKFTSSYDSVVITTSEPSSGENARVTNDGGTVGTINGKLVGENTYTVTQYGLNRTGSERMPGRISQLIFWVYPGGYSFDRSIRF